MTATAKFLRRHPSEVKPWTETCGQIRPLIEDADGAAAEVHHLEITDAKLHYHERTDEIYYVIGGKGRMSLDDEEIELTEGRGCLRSARRKTSRLGKSKSPRHLHAARSPERRPRNH